LSAKGSRNSPNIVCKKPFLAKKPSRKSLKKDKLINKNENKFSRERDPSELSIKKNNRGEEKILKKDNRLGKLK